MNFESLPSFAGGATQWLNGIVKPGFKIFEYGAGSSTLYLLRRGAKVTSIEHEPMWCDLIKEIEVKVITPQPTIPQYKYGPDTYTSWDWDLKDFILEDYVKYIDTFPNMYFDLVIINGKARASCMKHAVEKIAPSGYLLLDDAQKSEYQESIDIYLKKQPSILFQEGRKMTKIWLF
jgi:hypothetical protein